MRESSTEKLLIKEENLPFKGQHFIQNTMAAISAAIALGIDLNIIKGQCQITDL